VTTKSTESIPEIHLQRFYANASATHILSRMFTTKRQTSIVKSEEVLTSARENNGW